MAMTMRQLGAAGPEVSAIGLGCMGMSGIYGPADEKESMATIHAALEAGVNLIDTGDFYGMGDNEMLIGRALKGRREKALLSVKFGALRAPDGRWLGHDARPAFVKTSLAYSLKRLGVEAIDIYRPARLDPAAPIEETVGAIAEMVKAGYVRWIGLSEVGPETIRRAVKVHPVVDLQIEYSLVSRGPEAKIFPALREMGMAATVYGVMSRGLLTRARTGAGDYRSRLPRFMGENRRRNDELAAKLEQLAAARGMTAAQMALAWVRTKQEFVVPVVGARTRAQLAQCLAAVETRLSAQEMAALEEDVPAAAVSGERYGEDQMRALDSEK